MSTKAKNVAKRTVVKQVRGISKETADQSKSHPPRNLNDLIKESRIQGDPSNPQPLSSRDVKKILDSRKPLHRPVIKGKVETVHNDDITKKSKSTTRNRVSTPPSRRVTKTQFFPSKNNYSEAIHHLDQYNIQPENVTTRKFKQTTKNTQIAKHTNAQKQIKLKREESLSDSISTKERPRTSTLQRISIVNNEAPIEISSKPTTTSELKNDEEAEETPVDVDEYEDDFDSYESDFENCSSSDSTTQNTTEISTEGSSSCSSIDGNNIQPTPPTSAGKDVEKKMDSGNFDLLKRREYSNIQSLIEKDNMKARAEEINYKSNLTSLSDEGFEESKSLQFLNFAYAKKKNERRKSQESRKKRGEELSNMIKLDCVNFTIFDQASVPYDEFIKRFGNINSMQAGVQTGEENIDEEMQTEEIETCAKWVQMPPKFSNKELTFFSFERLGVGPELEVMLKHDREIQNLSLNETRFNKFLINTGQLMLKTLKEQLMIRDRLKKFPSENSFSAGMILYKPPSEFLGRRKIKFVTFCPWNSSIFLSVHISESSESNLKSMVHVYNIQDSIPEHHLVCYGQVNTCCFGIDPSIVFGGLDNGTLVAWDTSDKTSSTKATLEMVEGDISITTPVFLTGVEISHCCSVVSIQFNLEHGSIGTFKSDLEPTKQVCSLDIEGNIIIWTVINSQQFTTEDGKTVTNLEKLKLYCYFRVSLQQMLPDMADLQCNDMFIISSDPTSLFIATNYGAVIQCTLNKDKSTSKKHQSENSTSACICLIMCPFSDAYFLAGYENGNVSLFSKKKAKPLMTMSCGDSVSINQSIYDIEWSTGRPCIYYTKNSENRIDIWDLSTSNTSPVESLSFQEPITSMKLSSSRTMNNEVYMIISTENTIQLHLMSQDQRQRTEEEFNSEIKTFFNFVDRL